MRRCEMLASPIKVGKLTLKNKMMTTSMSPCKGYIEDEAPTIQMLNYMEERAKGGLALMCQTVLPFTRKDRPEGLPPVHPLPAAYDEDSLPDRHGRGRSPARLRAGWPALVRPRLEARR